MIVARNSAFSEKRDLHIGGLGVGAQTRPAMVADPRGSTVISLSRPFFAQAREVLEDAAREVVKSANHALRGNPWAALSLGAALGLTVGYLLSRRS